MLLVGIGSRPAEYVGVENTLKAVKPDPVETTTYTTGYTAAQEQQQKGYEAIVESVQQPVGRIATLYLAPRITNNGSVQFL